MWLVAFILALGLADNENPSGCLVLLFWLVVIGLLVGFLLH